MVLLSISRKMLWEEEGANNQLTREDRERVSQCLAQPWRKHRGKLDTFCLLQVCVCVTVWCEVKVGKI